MVRIKPLDYGKMSSEQKEVADDIIASRGKIVGPFIPWLRSAKLADRTQKLGAYCRYESSLASRLSELAILIVARDWTIQLEWNAHKPIALKAGIEISIINAIANRTVPIFKNNEEEVVYNFSKEILEVKNISDGTYLNAVNILGELGVVDLLAILGYYCSVGMVLNTFKILPEDGAEQPLI
jgi:4-carboxymuconolactone decarboxylase